MTGLVAGLPAPLLLLTVVVVLAVEGGLPVGVFVPGTAVTLTVGALAGPEGLPAAVVAVAAGAVAGGQLGFWLGRRRRHRVVPFAVVSRLPHGPWQQAGRLLARYPIATVGVGQWASWARVVVPRVAGWVPVSPMRFGIVQSISATTWAATLTTVGHLVGETARDDITFALGIPLVAVAVVLMTSGWLLRRTWGAGNLSDRVPPCG